MTPDRVTGRSSAELEPEMRVGFKRHLHAELSDGNGAFLFSERGVTALRGGGIESVARLLDGTRSLSDLLRDPPRGMGAEQVMSLIDELRQAGLVDLRIQRAGALDAHELAFWEAGGVDIGTAVSSRTALVGLVGVGSSDVEPVRAALSAAGLNVVVNATPAESADFSVVLCMDYLDPRLAEVDAQHRALGRPWLLCKPIGAQPWIGPVFGAQDFACWHCLAERLWANRHAEACMQETLGRQGPAIRPSVTVAPLMSAVTNLAVLESMKWLAGYRYHGQRCVWTFDSFDLDGRRHELRARPQCSACGDPDLVRTRTQQPVILRSRVKTSYGGGGHRARSAEQMMTDYRHLISPVTGVIKEIERDPRAPEGFHSFRSGPNLGAHAGGMDALRRSVREESGGKGATESDAKVGALCEALERTCGKYHGDESRIQGSFRSLGERAIHPNDCMLYDERQFQDRTEWNAEHAPFQYVCEPFDDNAVLDWTPVWSLTEERHRLLPTGMLYYGGPGNNSIRADSNGNAAGSSMEDAVLQGMLELVERDAVGIWWYNRLRVPGVDIATFGDPWLDRVQAWYVDLGRELWVLDVTTDMGIPAMAAVSRRTGWPHEEIMLGFGAHMDPSVALRRAVTELNQLIPAIVYADPSNDYDSDDQDAVYWWRYATIRQQSYLIPKPDAKLKRAEDYSYTPSPDLIDDVRTITTTMSNRGLDVLVLDQTRPDIGIPVVKVIGPGMRHFWARFGCGRLYDVPVRTGQLTTPTEYDALNPLPLFL